MPRPLPARAKPAVALAVPVAVALALAVVATAGVAAAQPFPATVAPPSASSVAPEHAFVLEPYGLVTVNGVYLLGDSSNTPDVPLWATAGASSFSFTARQTRLGLRGAWLTPPSRVGVRRVAGLVEFDFFGGFAGQGLGYFFPAPRLRVATATVEWRTVRLSFGQDWSLLAPLNPDSALHVAVSGFATSGNLWARIPQFRVDGVVAIRRWRLVWAGALVAEVQADAIPPAQNAFATVRIPQGGESALAPAGEARLAVAHDLFGKAVEIGVSGHLGKREIAFVGGHAARLNGAVALDVTLPLPAHLSLKGEAYWGDGLDAFFGGIGQGIAFSVDATGAITFVGNGIADAGGWGQLAWAPLGWLTAYAGGGVDQPKAADLLAINAATNRTLNAAAYVEGAVELARGFKIWLEYDFLHTEYQASPTQQTHVLSLSGQLAF